MTQRKQHLDLLPPEPFELPEMRLNESLVKMSYAVRGPIADKAQELKLQLVRDPKSLPFDKVISLNIGNPQSLGQKPITFYRQVISICEYPDILQHPAVNQIYPRDVQQRARRLLKAIGSTGAYSESQGISLVRQSVANWLDERDGSTVKADPSDIFLTAGASSAVSMIMTALVGGNTDASAAKPSVLIPSPQYPLYSATLTLLAAKAVPYELSEDGGWSTSTHSIRDSLTTDSNVQAVVVINPGNPTGSILSRKEMGEIVDLAIEHDLVILSDEVYQDNVDTQSEWISYRKFLLSHPRGADVKMISFHSTSKGFSGECGRRGGLMHLHNIPNNFKSQLIKLASVSLCPPITGQIAVDMLVNPPRRGDESYDLWLSESQSIKDDIKKRLDSMSDCLNKLEGVECNRAQGAMYLFPSFTLSPSAVKEAKRLNYEPDLFYAMRLLEATGLCVVPGSGFGQREGTWHFRTTALAPNADEYMPRLESFHESFMREFAL